MLDDHLFRKARTIYQHPSLLLAPPEFPCSFLRRYCWRCSRSFSTKAVQEPRACRCIYPCWVQRRSNSAYYLLINIRIRHALIDTHGRWCLEHWGRLKCRVQMSRILRTTLSVRPFVAIYTV
jgi:hypothetical protein